MATTCNIPKTCSVLVGILSVHLCYFNSLVVDDFLSGCFLISSGFFMVVHMLFLELLSSYTFCSLIFLLCFMSSFFFGSSFLFILSFNCFCLFLLVYM